MDKIIINYKELFMMKSIMVMMILFVSAISGIYADSLEDRLGIEF